MNVKEFQKYVYSIKRRLDWNKYHTPKELLLGIVEEIGEFRNLIKWEENYKITKSMLLGKKIYQAKIDEKQIKYITNNQINQIYYLLSMNGKLDTISNKNATNWIFENTNKLNINEITYYEAHNLISKIIREQVVDFFGDILWYTASLADYCEVDLEKLMDNIIKKQLERFPIDKVKGTTGNILKEEWDGKYKNNEGNQ
jgi:NTP pyrophosphatase (non-canonical NTP hydrolase)